MSTNKILVCFMVCTFAIVLGIFTVNAESSESPIYVIAELDGSNCNVQSDFLNMRPFGLLKVQIINKQESESSIVYRVFREGEDTPIIQGEVLSGGYVTKFLSVESGRYCIQIFCKQLIGGDSACKGEARLTWHIK